jgi:hypothetical protein
MKKQLLTVACLSLVFSLFLITYLMVWLSGEYDDNQYTDTYRVFVTCGLALSYCTLKAEEKEI